MLYRFTKKQRITILIISVVVSIISLMWYLNQSSAVSMMLLVMAAISVISQFILIKNKVYKIVEEEL